MKRQILIPLFIMSSLVFATILVILFGKGYRITFNQDLPQIAKTGILVANSSPNGAQVFIDNHLTTATDSTINLAPGTYIIKIQKEGYFPWEKKLKIEEEVVTKAQALLFPVAPRLESIARTPVQNPLIDPTGTKIAFQIASESSIRKNGIYILNMSSFIEVPILTLQNSSTKIADDTLDLFSQSKLQWSPDSTQLLALIDKKTPRDTTSSYLLFSNKFNDSPQDVTAVLQSVFDTWKQQKQERDSRLYSGLKNNLSRIIKEHFSVLALSPDETKILYSASTSAELPIIIKPRRLSINTLLEQRQLAAGEVYVYVIKEDTNMRIPVKLPDSCLPSKMQALENLSPYPDKDKLVSENCVLPIKWLPNSTHLLYINDKKISIMDDDGSNNITIFAGPFDEAFAVPWPNSSKIVILTNFSNPNTSPTLYTIGLK